MSRKWNASHPMALQAWNETVSKPQMRTVYDSLMGFGVVKVIQPKVSGNVMRLAVTTPQKIDCCASQRALPRRAMNVWNDRYETSARGTKRGVSTKFLHDRNARTPCLRYARAGGSRTQTTYRYTTPKARNTVAVAYPISASSKSSSRRLPKKIATARAMAVRAA